MKAIQMRPLLAHLARGLTALPLALILALGSAAVLIVGAPGALAEEEKKQKTRRVPTISAPVFKKLEQSQEMIDAKQYNEAERLLQGMLDAGRGQRYNGNERAQIYNMLGYVNFAQERYGRAIDAYENVLVSREDINEGLEATTLYTLAQLNFVRERYDSALRYMEEWLTKANNPGPEPYIFMGQVYYQKQDFRSAVPMIERGIDVAQQRGTAVKENWWALLNYLYYEQENWPKVLEILEVLVKQFPKRDYWYRLAGVYGQEGDEDRQLKAMESAYRAGYLDREKDLTTLSGLLMQAEIPYRAARVMDKGIKDGLIEKTARNWRGLGQAWQLAQEVDKAIDALKKSGELDDNGRVYEQLATLYLEKEQFKSCVSASDSALRKGGLRKVQSVHVIRGMCLYNDDKLQSARAAFVRARTESRNRRDNTHERMSAQWITFIDTESNRRTQLAAAQKAWEEEMAKESTLLQGGE
ncbi:MAG: tetratricopeptide repeat protein [Pseudomonadota bacterium]